MKKLGFDLILLGDPTSGKDTQASILTKKYFLSPVESGKQWRKMVQKNDFYGRWLKRTFGKGYPAPVEIVKKFLSDSIKKSSSNKNLIFIGNPRLKPEAQFAVKLLKQYQRDFFVLYLKLPDKEIYRRAEHRKVQEDNRVNTKRRIDWTKKQVGKTVKYFKGINKLKFVNGKQSIQKVSKDIQSIIHDYSRSRAN